MRVGVAKDQCSPLGIWRKAGLAVVLGLAEGVSPALAEVQPVGNLEQATRDPAGFVRFAGWALDTEGSGNPVKVVAVYGGALVFAASTSGPREDITQVHAALNPTNVVFGGTSGEPIACRAGDKVVALAISAAGEYGVIGQIPIEGC